MTTMAEMQKVVDEAFVDIYLAYYQVKLDYPLRLETVGDSSPTVSDKSKSYILDCEISNDEVTNEDVLDRAAYLGADRVVPKDTLGDVDATLESFEEFLVRYDDHEYEGDFVVPLQADETATHSQCHGSAVDLLNQYGYDTDRTYGIGGIKDDDPIEQLQACMETRSTLGEDIQLHAFGMGCSEKIAKAVREWPELLDSLDMSTPASVAKWGKVIDSELTQRKMEMPRGRLSTTWGAALAEFNLITMNYIMSPLPRDSDIDHEIVDPELQQLLGRHNLKTNTAEKCAT